MTQAKPPNKITVSQGMQTIFRREKVTKNYCKVSNDTSQNINLTFAERGLLLFIISLPECSKDGIAWRILKDHILANTCEAEHSVNKILKSLREKGHAVFTEWTEPNGEKKTQYLFSEVAVPSWQRSAATQKKKRSERGVKAYKTMVSKGNCMLINQNGNKRKIKEDVSIVLEDERRTANAQQFGEMVERVINKNGINPKVEEANREGFVKKTIWVFNYYLNKFHAVPSINWNGKGHKTKLEDIITLLTEVVTVKLEREPTKSELLMCFAFMLDVIPEAYIKGVKGAEKFQPAYIASTFSLIWKNFDTKIVARLKEKRVEIPEALREELTNAYRTYFPAEVRLEIANEVAKIK